MSNRPKPAKPLPGIVAEPAAHEQKLVGNISIDLVTTAEGQLALQMHLTENLSVQPGLVFQVLHQCLSDVVAKAMQNTANEIANLNAQLAEKNAGPQIVHATELPNLRH